jgi:hypothetical protein
MLFFLSGARHAKSQQLAILKWQHLKWQESVVWKCGTLVSIAAARTDTVEKSFDKDGAWRTLRDCGLHATADGFTSKNVDATMFACMTENTIVQHKFMRSFIQQIFVTLGLRLSSRQIESKLQREFEAESGKGGKFVRGLHSSKPTTLDVTRLCNPLCHGNAFAQAR